MEYPEPTELWFQWSVSASVMKIDIVHSHLLFLTLFAAAVIFPFAFSAATYVSATDPLVFFFQWMIFCVKSFRCFVQSTKPSVACYLCSEASLPMLPMQWSLPSPVFAHVAVVVRPKAPFGSGLATCDNQRFQYFSEANTVRRVGCSTVMWLMLCGGYSHPFMIRL